MQLSVSKRAQKPASNFFHAQAGLCGVAACVAVTMTIFGYMIHNKFKTMAEQTTEAAMKEVPAEYQKLIGQVDHLWIAGIGQLVWVCIVGSILLFLAKYVLENGMSLLLKIWGGCDGLAGCIYILYGIFAFVGFFIALAAYNAFANGQALCESVQTAATTAAGQQAVAAAPPATQAALTAALASTTFSPEQAKVNQACAAYIAGIRSAVGIACFMVCCIGFLTCKAAGLLCFAAKNAFDAAKIFDDEERGGGYADDFDNE